MLLARYQAYRASGLAGIAPYDRGDGRTSEFAADLRKASQAAQALAKYLPGFQKVLLGYPQATMPGMQERFFWFKSLIHGEMTYVLAHILVAPEGAARVVTRREYYVSTGYNGEQTVAGFLPVQGGTVVVSNVHAFTDQVTGFGGSLKREHRQQGHGGQDEGDLRGGAREEGRAVARSHRREGEVDYAREAPEVAVGGDDGVALLEEQADEGRVSTTAVRMISPSSTPRDMIPVSGSHRNSAWRKPRSGKSRRGRGSASGGGPDSLYPGREAVEEKSGGCEEA